ncbi:hypothetical protein IT087_00905 [Candidatus Uhrbacteria bacterium]|nr:hypothetical protein [Candidatus Uhrbacteria bacterium]
MKLIDPFLQMANAAELQNVAPYDPVAPTFVSQAGSYMLCISGMSHIGEFDSMDARVSIGFGLDRSGSPDDLGNLMMIFDPAMGVWRLEFELKGDDPPPPLVALAARLGLANPEEAVALVGEDQPAEVAQAMVDFIVAELERLKNRPIPSKIPLPAFIANGGRLT